MKSFIIPTKKRTIDTSAEEPQRSVKVSVLVRSDYHDEMTDDYLDCERFEYLAAISRTSIINNQP